MASGLCFGCTNDREVRNIWLVCTWVKLCPDCYKKLQKNGTIPRNISWDGTRVPQ